jgi:hypothetical protein
MHRNDEPPCDDAPESCPTCGAPNTNTDDGSWVCNLAPGFCSVKCATDYVKAERSRVNALVAGLNSTAKLIKAHNAKCPRGCKTSRKYCTHFENPDNR